ncbi:MAG: hypothetical protein AAF708_21070 [Deinococcota bacterium]
MHNLTEDTQLAFALARNEFQGLRRRAMWRGWLERLRSTPSHLQPFNEVYAQGVSVRKSSRQLVDVRLADIIGSVGRANEYTTQFLPRHAHDEERWARVRIAVTSDRGVPPLELLEVNGKYYVEDGHHRVSVLKALGASYTTAYVTHVEVMQLAQPTLSPAPQVACPVIPCCDNVCLNSACDVNL